MPKTLSSTHFPDNYIVNLMLPFRLGLYRRLRPLKIVHHWQQALDHIPRCALPIPLQKIFFLIIEIRIQVHKPILPCGNLARQCRNFLLHGISLTYDSLQPRFCISHSSFVVQSHRFLKALQKSLPSSPLTLTLIWEVTWLPDKASFQERPISLLLDNNIL